MAKIVLPQMIDYYRRQNNLTMEQLGNKLGKTKSAISRWISGNRSPMVDDLEKLSTLFGVDVKTLMYGADEQNGLITKTGETMRSLTPARQQNVYTYADNQLQEQNHNVVRMPKTQVKLLGAVSAGTGEELQDDSTEIDYTGTVPEYDYALQVNGDSMEPLFEDQQIIFVKRAEEAFNGQIVIAYVDGKAYVKKYHCNEAKCELVSLNSKYSPIDVSGNEDFKIKGIVVL